MFYETAFSEMQTRINRQMNRPIDVPIPEDAGGGYTHEQHKRNARALFESGLLYEATGDIKYRDFFVDLASQYAEIYTDLPLHPKQKEQSPGRLFWQSLNEAWFLVHAAQGYTLIRPDLDEATRQYLEDGFFYPISEFLSEGQPETFNKIHNHGTWATAAVGLTGYALEQQDYVEKALLGLDRSGEGGFLKQLEILFSPDGYYNEGPYYQRYALMPFVLFAQAIEKNEPERQIFERRDGILQKAIHTTIQQSYGGLFFPINDAIKDKDIATSELLHGVAIAYELTGDTSLLSVAEQQGKVIPTPAGKAVSEALAAGMSQPFDYRSMRLLDGADGTAGALDILRESSDLAALTAVVKNTSQGLGHGHFDKMGLLVFDRGNEILRDYGAARFLNVEAKYGGHYLPENNDYAKQTIAHNTLVVDGSSHFEGRTAEGNKHAPELGHFQSTSDLTATSARIDTAYPGVVLTRSVAMLRHQALEAPVIIDVMRANSQTFHDFDFPFHYNGQLIETNYDIQVDEDSRTPLGDKNGYQYLWKVGEAKLPDGFSQTTLLLDRRFYTLTSRLPPDSVIALTELGANDPNFNLRREPALILRGQRAKSFTSVTVVEPHGEYNPTEEFTLNSRSQIEGIDYMISGSAIYLEVKLKSGEIIALGLSEDADLTIRHSVDIGGRDVSWTGPYAILKPPI